MKNALRALDQPRLRRGELLDLLCIERGLFLGWEERGLFKYTGPTEGKRLYSVADYMRLGIAKRAVDCGVQPVHIWPLLNDDSKLGVIGGTERYAVAQVFGSQAVWRLATETSFRAIVSEAVGGIVLALQLTVLDLRAMIADTLAVLRRHWRDEDIDAELSIALSTIANNLT
jgi:DNA-binding transcriptional MerR regulator